MIIYTDWCPACKQYSLLFKEPSVVATLDGVVLIHSNRDHEPEISKLFDIDGEYILRTFSLDKEGQIIEDLNSSNSNWWHYLPVDNPDYLIQFVNKLKNHNISDR